MPVSAGDILRVVAKMSYEANDIQNVYHLFADASSSLSDDQIVLEIAQWLDDAYAEIDQHYPDTLTFDTVAVWNVTTDTFLGERGWPTLTNGGSTVNDMPSQVSPLILFNTGINRSQGRKFLGPTGTSVLDTNGTASSQWLSDAAVWAAEILAGVVLSDANLLPGNWNEAKNRFARWLVAIVRDFLATQRRRYRGSGS